jgi:uncharacterized secreted protein with C-terminal beta-propeller domain
VEKEIRKRTLLYAVVATFSAIMLGAFVYNLPINSQVTQRQTQPEQPFLNVFSSLEDLRSFLMTKSSTPGAFQFYSPSDVDTLTNAMKLGRLATVDVKYAESLRFDYSTTNIQVAGVDEADIVKTDGQYIYHLAGNNVTILKAYPPEEAEVLSRITYNDTYPVGLFVSEDKLVVLGSHYVVSTRQYSEPFVVDIKTSVNVYDISQRTQPLLMANYTLSGSYFHSRMIDDYLYFVVSQPAYVIYDTVVLPKIYTSQGMREIAPSEIYHANSSDNYFLFTTIGALNIHRTEEELSYRTLMLGGASSMYMSLHNVYITFPEPDEDTSIYRISVDKESLNIEAHGKVPGRELNQFSMDENENNFRIATASWVNGTPHSNVYTLNMNLTIVGRLENIAPGETLDSARFIGNRAYLSTSVVQRDPFFVIDLENASAPKILGYLKIPGFTRYLHPYDDDHLMGIGRDGASVKMSLFDVINVSAPIELDKYGFESSSDTPVLTEHKAFLFDRARSLLALPISIWPSWYSSNWQGAYVFTVTLTGGFVLKGNVTHQDSSINPWDSDFYVNRELYIENVLYTVSNRMIRMNILSDLTLIKQIKLP